MKALKKRDRDVLTRVADGVPDLQVCRELGLSVVQFEQSLARIRERAEAHPDSQSAAVYYERALRRRAENAMKSLDARFHALMDVSQDAVLVVNGLSGIIKLVNERAVRMFGHSAEELVGKSVEILVPAEVRAIHPAYRVGFLSSVRRREMGYHPPFQGIRADGTAFQIAIALTATTADEDVMVVCTEHARWDAANSVPTAQAAVERR